MKYFLSLSFLLLFFASLAQNGFVFIADVKSDSIQLKWTPKNLASLYSIWENGASIEITDISSISKQSIQIEPIAAHLKKFDKVQFEKENALIEQLLNAKAKTDKEKKFAFALLMIESSVSKKMNVASAQMISLPNNFSGTISCSITVKEIPTQTTSFDTKTNSIYPDIETAKISVDQKKIANLEWDAAALDKNYLGFIIERKIEDSLYITLSREPYIHFTTSAEKETKLAAYRDESVKQGKRYIYRITAINYFGQKTGVSKEMSVYVPLLVNAQLNINSITAKENKRILSCEVAIENKDVPLHLDKLVLLRSKQKDAEFLEIAFEKKSINDSIIELIVTSELESGDAFYYQLIGISKDNDSVKSPVNYFFTLDQQAPQMATDLKGKVDSLGIARITWQNPRDKDIQGYKIFRSNSLKEEFVQLNSSFVKSAAFFDTLNLNSLTNEIYYFVVAVDENFNNSPPSDTLELLKPDTIAPVPAIIEELILSKKGIEIKWQNAKNTDKTIQYLYRISEAKTDSLLIKNESISYFDSLVNFGEMNSYFIKTVDLSKNSSKSNSKGLIYEPGFRPALLNVKPKLSENKKSVLLSWDSPKSEVFQYFVYKKKNDGKFLLVKTIETTVKNEFLDAEVNISNNYEYVIQYQTKEGVRSLKHAGVKIRM